MRKIFISILLAIVAATSLTSCKGMLEEKNYGNPTVDSMMASPDNVVLLVGQAYADIKWLHDHWGYWGVASLTSDECVCPVRMPGEHWLDSYYWTRLNDHSWNWMGDAFKNIWNTTISGAVLCNKLIVTLEQSKESMGEDIYNQFVGELEVLRSYYYYMLFDCFGRIPYLETFEDKTEALMEPELVWSNLVNSLERNAPNMPVVNDGNRAANYGRVTQGFAYALLARLYLNAESFGCTVDNIELADNTQHRDDFKKIQSVSDFYTNAVKCCDKVIDSGAYSIEDDWFANFKIDNEGSKENIFVIVENGIGEFDSREIGSMSNKLRLTMLTLHYSHQDTYGMVEKPWNGFCARPGFIDRYSKKDLRGPGPNPPEAPIPPEKEDVSKLTADERAAYEKKYKATLEAEYYGPLETYAEAAKEYGTQSKQRWGWFVGPIFDKDGKLLKDENGHGAVCRQEINSLTNATWFDGARCFKYEVDKEGKYQYAENDFVLMRYADVLWMKEEAILRGGSGTSGTNTSDFKKMLSRTMAYEDNPAAAYTEEYGSSFDLDFIIDERGREFAWECVRRRDLIRFDKFADPTYVEYVKETATNKYREWFPIPYSVLEKSKLDENGNRYWTQNEGYDDIL